MYTERVISRHGDVKRFAKQPLNMETPRFHRQLNKDHVMTALRELLDKCAWKPLPHMHLQCRVRRVQTPDQLRKKIWSQCRRDAEPNGSAQFAAIASCHGRERFETRQNFTRKSDDLTTKRRQGRFRSAIYKAATQQLFKQLDLKRK